MKKIVLLSDTHGYIDSDILKYIQQADEVWHAGDIGNIQVTDTIKKYKPLRAVYGNIDGKEARKEFPEYLFFEIENLKVLIIHIGGTPGRYAKGVNELLKKYQPDLFIDGHSHILKVKFDKKNNMLFMNPGAIGKSGFHKKRTLLIFSIENATVKDLKVVEWDR